MGSMKTFAVGTVVVIFLIVAWMLAVKIGADIGSSLSQLLNR
jgi:hypothetical protein